MTFDYEPRHRPKRGAAVAHLGIGGFGIGIAILLALVMPLSRWEYLLMIGVLFCGGCVNVGIGAAKLRGGGAKVTKPSGLILWGGGLLVLSFILFFGAAFMMGVGATLWGPLPGWEFVVIFGGLMASVPAGAVGVILLVVGIVRRARSGRMRDQRLPRRGGN